MEECITVVCVGTVEEVSTVGLIVDVITVSCRLVVVGDLEESLPVVEG